ncbi:MAG: hypothetical protein WC248_06350 [Candidatus Methanomethylophilaceae archaeon]|jgi:hypothetical protein
MVEFNEEEHEYTLEGIHVPSVSELLKPVMSDFECDPKYAERGKTVHNLTELWDTGLYMSELADDELATYILAYEEFHDQHDIKVSQIEQMVFNKDLVYAGRLDRLWEIDGKMHLTDTKTGGKYKQHLFQVCGYKMASTRDVEHISNLYLNPFSFKLHTWTEQEEEYGNKMIEALSMIYWDNHRRDRKDLDKIIAKGEVTTELPF